MNWVIENWYIIVALIAVAGVAIWLILGFFKLPTDKQKAKVKEWLIWACIEAEKELQTGTGQLKLRRVYDLFCSIPAFTFIAKIISFDTFSDWVSEALTQAKNLIVSNNALAIYVYGSNAPIQIEKLQEQIKEQNKGE